MECDGASCSPSTITTPHSPKTTTTTVAALARQHRSNASDVAACSLPERSTCRRARPSRQPRRRHGRARATVTPLSEWWGESGARVAYRTSSHNALPRRSVRNPQRSADPETPPRRRGASGCRTARPGSRRPTGRRAAPCLETTARRKVTIGRLQNYMISVAGRSAAPCPNAGALRWWRKARKQGSKQARIERLHYDDGA